MIHCSRNTNVHSKFHLVFVLYKSIGLHERIQLKEWKYMRCAFGEER